MPPDPYRRALLVARRREFALRVQAARDIDRALARFAGRLTRQMAGLVGPARERVEASLAVVRLASEELDRAIARAVADGRDVAFENVLDTWRAANRRLLEARDIPLSTLGAISRPNLTMAGVFDAVGSPGTWRTLVRGHVENAAREAGGIVREALLKGESPDAVARKLRRYVRGGEALDELFDGDRIDLRQRIPPELRGAARQMQHNAERIAVTEVHNARTEAEIQHFARDPMVEAIQWQLAPDRGTLSAPDECDVLATADFHGLGSGIYPVTAVPPEPHPNGRCERVPVVASEPVANPPEGRLSVGRYRIPRQRLLTEAGEQRVREQVNSVLAFTEQARRAARRRSVA